MTNKKFPGNEILDPGKSKLTRKELTPGQASNISLGGSFWHKSQMEDLLRNIFKLCAEKNSDVWNPFTLEELNAGDSDRYSYKEGSGLRALVEGVPGFRLRYLPGMLVFDGEHFWVTTLLIETVQLDPAFSALRANVLNFGTGCNDTATAG